MSKTVAGVTSTYTYDPNHPYAVDTVTNVNGGTYTATYDADGNMVSRDGDAITWTPANLPASIAGTLGSSSFNYGPDGNRYYQAETFNGVTTDTTYIAGGLFEVVASTSGTGYRHNIVADGQVIAVHTITSGGNASTSYLHYDQLGSVNAITSDQGSVIQTMSFDAFGNRRLATDWDYGVSQNTLATMNDYTNRGYTDQEQLDNLSLVDMNGRVYDPTVGRFISADPTGGSGLGRYTYGMDGPLVYTDPSGFTAGSNDCPASGTNNGVKCNPAGDNDSGGDNVLGPIINIGSLGSAAGGVPGSLSGGSGSATTSVLNVYLGDVDVNAKAANNSASNTINLGEVDVNAKAVPANPPPPRVVYMPIIPSAVPKSIDSAQLHRLLVEEGVCRGGVMSSRSFNPNLPRNMEAGALAGGTLVAAIGAGVVINIIGFPEVEMAEGGAGIWGLLAWGGTVGTGAFVGATYGVSAGGAIEYGLTPPTSVPCM